MALNDKDETRKQWDTDPCGAVTAGPAPVESAPWYASVRGHRYAAYAPWMPAVMRFDEWRDRDVLEIGTGLGSDHLSFALGGARMSALDLSIEHLRHTQRHLAFHGLATGAVLGDAERSPLRSESFDLVYSFGVLHHTPAIERAISELHRVLRPGGTALIAIYHRNSWFFWISIMLVDGVLKLGLLRKGWRRLLSEIEYRSAGNDALPLVRVYSRRQAQRLFSKFAALDVHAHGVDRTHFWRLGRLLPGSTGPDRLERWLGRGGWYLVVRARK